MDILRQRKVETEVPSHTFVLANIKVAPSPTQRRSFFPQRLSSHLTFRLSPSTLTQHSMTTSKNPNLIADLTALALEIDDHAEERTKELKGLILQLPGAAKAERAAAVKYLQTVTAERDQALAKLGFANDEVSGLREEVRLLQDAARGGNQRKRKAVSNADQDEGESFVSCQVVKTLCGLIANRRSESQHRYECA